MTIFIVTAPDRCGCSPGPFLPLQLPRGVVRVLEGDDGREQEQDGVAGALIQDADGLPPGTAARGRTPGSSDSGRRMPTTVMTITRNHSAAETPPRTRRAVTKCGESAGEPAIAPKTATPSAV